MKSSKLILASFALAAVAVGVHAQQTAQMRVDRDGAIEAGSTVTFTVKLDKVPNVDVNVVSLYVSPVRPDPDAPNAASSGGAVNPEKTIYRVPITVPVTAHAGTWHVTALALGIPSAPNKQLKFNDVSFEVKEKRDIILPDSGAIEISK
jgi:hypothetical protein